MAQMSDGRIRIELIKKGVANLQEYGYPSASPVDGVIAQLRAEIAGVPR